MEINIKLETTDIEKMLSRIYGFKEGSIKVSISCVGEIIATASEFPTQPAPALYYGPGVRGITSDPNCALLDNDAIMNNNFEKLNTSSSKSIDTIK